MSYATYQVVRFGSLVLNNLPNCIVRAFIGSIYFYSINIYW